jgi:hypothetical protein
VRRRLKHIVAIGTLVSYLLVGAIGFWSALEQIFQFGTHPWVITKGKLPTPGPTKVIWTQQKHYPSSARDDVFVAATVSDLTPSHLQPTFIIVSIQHFGECSSSCSRPYSPRSPPCS